MNLMNLNYLAQKFRRPWREVVAGAIRTVRLYFVPMLMFGAVSWRPRGPYPVYLSYFPDSITKDKTVGPLFLRWIRGNRVNNNGDTARFLTLLLNARKIVADGVPGDFAELGVWRGNSAAVLASAVKDTDRSLYLFDTFSGFDDRDLVGIDVSHGHEFENTSVEFAKRTIQDLNNVKFCVGFFPDSVTAEVEQCRFAFVHVDCDLYEPMKAALEFFYPRISSGGMMFLHDYSSGQWQGATAAIDEFCKTLSIRPVLVGDKSGTAVLQKWVTTPDDRPAQSPSAV
jgi:hypothetical protein